MRARQNGLALATLALMCLISANVRAQADGLTSSPDGPEAVKVYYTEEQALAKVFAGADSLWTDSWTLRPADLTELSARLGWPVTEETLLVHRARRGEADLGFAVITEGRGRFKPITILVKVSPRLVVDMVLVMVYRESRGDGVKRQRFLKQFRQKSASSPLRLNRDLVGVSGATMSSRGVTAAVKRVLALLDYRYGSKVGP